MSSIGWRYFSCSTRVGLCVILGYYVATTEMYAPRMAVCSCRIVSVHTRRCVPTSVKPPRTTGARGRAWELRFCALVCACVLLLILPVVCSLPTAMVLGRGFDCVHSFDFVFSCFGISFHRGQPSWVRQGCRLSPVGAG